MFYVHGEIFPYGHICDLNINGILFELKLLCGEGFEKIKKNLKFHYLLYLAFAD